MNTENDHDYFRVTFLGESEKAIHVKLDHSAMTYWIPKTLCNAEKATPGAYEGILEIESWFAEKEGMNEC